MLVERLRVCGARILQVRVDWNGTTTGIQCGFVSSRLGNSSDTYQNVDFVYDLRSQTTKIPPPTLSRAAGFVRDMAEVGRQKSVRGYPFCASDDVLRHTTARDPAIPLARCSAPPRRFNHPLRARFMGSRIREASCGGAERRIYFPGTRGAAGDEDHRRVD